MAFAVFPARPLKQRTFTAIAPPPAASRSPFRSIPHLFPIRAYHQIHKTTNPNSRFLAAHSTQLLLQFTTSNYSLMRENFTNSRRKIFSTKSRNFLANVQKRTSILQFVTQRHTEWLLAVPHRVATGCATQSGYWLCHTHSGYWLCHTHSGYWLCHTEWLLAVPH